MGYGWFHPGSLKAGLMKMGREEEMSQCFITRCSIPSLLVSLCEVRGRCSLVDSQNSTENQPKSCLALCQHHYTHYPLNSSPDSWGVGALWHLDVRARLPSSLILVTWHVRVVICLLTSSTKMKKVVNKPYSANFYIFPTLKNVLELSKVYCYLICLIYSGLWIDWCWKPRCWGVK